MTTTNATQTDTVAQRSSDRLARLHQLDWLRVLAILGVFVFHCVLPFDQLAWAINNVQQSSLATLFIVIIAPWGMPLFLFMSGAGTWFALRPRTGRQYALERVQRLFLPFVVGCLLLTPLQL